MKRFFAFLFISSLFSCGSYKYELWFNADGSGKTKMHFDFGEMIKQMKSAFKDFGANADSTFVGTDSINANVQYDSLYSENQNMVPTDIPISEYENTDSFYQDQNYYDSTYTYDGSYVDTFNFGMEEVKPDPVKERMSQFFEKLKGGRTVIDTSFTFYDALIGADSTVDQNKELLKNSLFTIHADSVKEELWFDILFTYKDEAQMKNMLNEFSRLSEKSNDFGANKNPSQFYYRHDVKKKMIIGLEYNLFESGSISENDKVMFEDMDVAQLDEILDLMGIKELETTIHLPGKLVEVKGADFTKIDDNTVVIKQNMKNYIKSGNVPGYEIIYK